MAIINVSSDSFNGDGSDEEASIRQRIEEAITFGADILDVGGQSTRPGAQIISEQEEIKRTVPAVKIARQMCDLPISIDTFKPQVAESAIKAGATIVNDIHGAEDHKMSKLVSSSGVDIVVMHSRGTPDSMMNLSSYPDGVVNEVSKYLINRANDLVGNYGIEQSRIIIDPGIGFAKTPEQSFELTNALEYFLSLGYRVLYGSSQKSFLGYALSAQNGILAPLNQRKTATTATTVFAILKEVNIVRVHDVRAAEEARRIVECIKEPALINNRMIRG